MVTVRAAVAALLAAAAPAPAGDDWILYSDPPPPIALSIGSNVGSVVHPLATQVVTFRFAVPVEGFGPEDVTVFRGTKGAFAPLSRQEFTLEVTGIGGWVEVQVPPGAAKAVGGSATSSGASLRNFYSDAHELWFPRANPLRFVRIPGGTYSRGSPDTERSRDPWERLHTVTLTRDYYIATTELSQSQWIAARGSWPGEPPNADNGDGPEFPAYNLSWADAQAFCATVSNPQFRYRLPTEAEWERAARAGTQTRFHFGDSLDADDNCGLTAERLAHMWFCGSTPDSSGAVGSLAPNAYGLYDMHGNVAEWVQDFFAPYSSSPLVDPVTTVGIEKVVRGGWFDSPAGDARSAWRIAEPVGFRDVSTGVRLAVDRLVTATVVALPPGDSSDRRTFLVEFSAGVTGLTRADVVLSPIGTQADFAALDSRRYIISLEPGTTWVTMTIPEGSCLPEGAETKVGSAFGSFPGTPWLSAFHGQP